MGTIRNLILKGLANPRDIPPYLRYRISTFFAPDYRKNVYEAEGDPDAQALLTLPMDVVNRDEQGYQKRPNMWFEGEEIIYIFNRLGYSVDVYDLYDDGAEPSNFGKYDVLFGGGDNFLKFSQLVPNSTLKIHFSSGMHWKQRKEQYEIRLDRLEQRKGVRLAPQRPTLLESDDTASVVDGVLARANSSAEKSWESALGDKPLRTVNVSHPETNGYNSSDRNFEDSRAKFLWFGGNGLVLKGLDVVLDAFSQLDGPELFVCGPIARHDEFESLYHEELYETPNIHTLGWVDLYSEQYYDLCRTCAYHVYPSASEGQSTAIATTMWHGVIPVVTPAVAKPGDWGIQLTDGRVETVATTVQRLAEMNPDEVEKMARRASEKARQMHDRESVSREAERALSELMEVCRTEA